MMNELKTLARPYAVAAYEFAQQCNQVDIWMAMLANIRLLVLTESMQKILNTPNVEAGTFLTILQPFAQKTLDEHGLNFLKLLVVKHRLALAPVVFELFEELKAQAENIVNINVTTAIVLNDVEQRTLVGKIAKHVNYKISPVFHVDDAIIAGAIIRVGDQYVLDGSLKMQLERLKKEF